MSFLLNHNNHYIKKLSSTQLEFKLKVNRETEKFLVQVSDNRKFLH